MDALRVFTVSSGAVTEGAVIETLHLKGAGIDIPAIIIGEDGRGRERGVLPVGNPPMVSCPDQGRDVWTSHDKCDKCGAPMDPAKTDSSYRHHPETGKVLGKLMFAEVGTTKAGKPKLFSKEKATTKEFIIVIFDTRIGFRGGNSHTGDKSLVPCPRRGQMVTGEYECPDCGVQIVPQDVSSGAIHPDAGEVVQWHPFPGEVIANGVIAQGDAGRMGSGEQLVAVMPKGVVFRTGYSGRLYGAPSSHYYEWDGEKILGGLTWDERITFDLF